ncbi:MAG: GntR family transcriptional regulator [Spirochaetales bacterium]|nr:GntR family transcriptional regulator [Spirochaetales bacterium]
MILNQQSPVPLYHQLARIILEKIRNGEYRTGAKIPSEPELAKEFALGRPTVRQATELLVRRRILLRKRGSGTYVREKEEEIDLFSLAGTMSAFEKKGIQLTRRIIKQIIRIKVDENKDNPFAGREAFFFSRLSSIAASPFLIEDIYLDSRIFSDISGDDFSVHSLSGIIEDRYQMKPTHGKQSFAVHYPDPEQTELLNIPETYPILFVKRYLHFREKENAIYSELFCKTDTFVFTQQIGGMPYE